MLTRSPGENVGLGDRRAQALGHRKGVMGVQTGQQHGELLAADAEDGVLVADGAVQGLGDMAQGLVAHRVAMCVVDSLEVVDIDRREREGGVGPVDTKVLVERLLEGAVTQQAGEVVVTSLVGHRLEEPCVVERGGSLRHHAGQEVEEGRLRGEAARRDRPR